MNLSLCVGDSEYRWCVSERDEKGCCMLERGVLGELCWSKKSGYER